ncbi:TPR-like protein [Ascodesmis nigricans]|uniref:TPR-like protein n=1 Tax=Ascodesmis nigricans TaxID=341454 RepID=A0A4S2N6T2_9PEZI|nr:TPR-like protein [Ascodesmis nigricans]
MSGVPHTTSPGRGPPHPQTNGHGPQIGMAHGKSALFQSLATVNEQAWLQIGSLTENMGDLDRAMHAYESALRHNPYSIPAMNSISCILRTKEQFPKAVEYLQSILNIDQNNGEIWGSLGHCYLMMDDLQKAYSAYQQALIHLRDPKEPKLWYGIGILYDRYGSLEHAEEAFSQVMRMEPNFEKANEIYFRLGIIYKQQQKYQQSLECFRYIVHDPPRPLTEEDIWFQIGHVHEQQKDYDNAKNAYHKVLQSDPGHAKVLQQLGWLHHQQSDDFASQELAIEYLEKSVSADNTDAQSWYLLGRCYMSQQKYPKAYEAYQQAVYRDGRNPTFWCSIGVLYYQINQYRDALDAYSRAIRLNPYISEVWYDLGTLYESCNNQTNDALDAYQRAAELDPTNQHIKSRLALLRNGQTNGGQHPNQAPPPQDVHPHSYQQPGVNGPPGPQWGSQGAQPQSAPPPPPPNRGPPNPLPQIPQGNTVPYRPGEPGPLPPQRHMSPDHLRRHPNDDSNRHPPLRRGLSPSPKFPTHSPQTNYPAPSPLQQPQPQAPAPPPPQVQQAPPLGQQPPSNPRILNPHHSHSASQHGPPPSGSGGSSMTLPPYQTGRVSPPPEVKPLVEEANYSHRLGGPSGGIASGAPPPPSASTAADAAQAQRERDDKSQIPLKRAGDWDDEDRSGKKPASNETRAGLDDILRRSPGPSHSRHESTDRPREEYHHAQSAPHSLPPLSQQNLPSMAERPAEPAREERKEVVEPAARKVEEEDDYDADDADEPKRPGTSGPTNDSNSSPDRAGDC